MGAPPGTDEFVNAFAMKRRREEKLSFYSRPRAAARKPRSRRKAHQASPLKPKTDDRRIITQGVCSMT